MSLRFLCGALAAVGLSGCFSVRLSETTYPEHKTSLNDGPGGPEGELYRFVRSKSERYTGEKVSIGLFPGFPRFAESMDIDYVGVGFCYFFCVPIAHCCFGMPTICTLFIEPFTMTDSKSRGGNLKDDADLISSGLIGAYRWRESPHVESEVDYSEDVLIDEGTRIDPAEIPVAKSQDGTKVYFEYPGFRALMKVVAADEKVDVAFPDGAQIRRFQQSMRNADHLVFTDRSMANEQAVKELFGQYCAWKSLRSKAAALVKEPGYAISDGSLKGSVGELQRDLKNISLDVGSYSRYDHAEHVKREQSLRGRIQKLESDRIGRLKTEVGVLFAKGELDAARKICAKEGSNLAEWHDRIDRAIAERKRKTAEEAERIRVQNKLKEIETLIARKSYGEAREKCEDKAAFDDVKHRIDIAEQKARAEAEESRIQEKLKMARKLCDQGHPRRAAFLCEGEKDERLASFGRSCMGKYVRKALPEVLDLFDRGDCESVLARTKFETEKQILAVRNKAIDKLKSMRSFNGVEFGVPIRKYGIPIKVDKTSSKEFMMSPNEKRLSYQKAEYIPSMAFRGFSRGEVQGTWEGGLLFRVIYDYAFDRDQQATTDQAEYEQTLQALIRKYGAPKTDKGFGGDMKHTFQSGRLMIRLQYVAEGRIDRGRMTLEAWSPAILEIAEKESEALVNRLRDSESRRVRAGGEEAL